MGALGALTFGAGGCLMLYAFLGMDISGKGEGISVPHGSGVDPSAIVNLDMLGRRDMVMMLACALIVVGALMMIASHIEEVFAPKQIEIEREPSSRPVGHSKHAIGWICACGTRNADFDAKKCWNCGAPRKDANWRCRCGAENEPDVETCPTCKRSRAAVY